MENQEEKQYLPIGSILQVKDRDFRFLVTGVKIKSDNDKLCDYAICGYPGGIAEGSVGINEDIIKNVCSFGSLKDETKIKELVEYLNERGIHYDKEYEKESYKNPSQYSPIGSIIKFKDFDNLAMVIAHGAEKNNEVCDYCVFVYDKDGSIMEKNAANNSDIEYILHEGFLDKEGKEYMNNMNYALDRVRREYEREKRKKEQGSLWDRIKGRNNKGCLLDQGENDNG